MKKNYLFGLLSLFTLLFTASCQEENLVGTSGDTAMVTFEVNTPTLTTRAVVGDGTTAKKLYVGVYENQNGTLAGPLEVSLIDEGETVTFTDRVAKVNLALAKNKEYSVIFWAETENNDDAMFNINWGDRELTLKSSLKANQEKYDAFWAQKTVTLTGAISEKIDLKRPFAQLNIGTSDKDDAAAAGIEVKNSQVVVKGAYTKFNLQSGEATNEGDVTYAMEAIAAIEGESFPAAGQSYLSLNYLLMNADKSTVDVDFSYEDKEDAAPYALAFTSVPVQRNYRTNIYGTLLTNSANYTVEILPGFGNEGEEDVANIVYASTADEVQKALNAAAEDSTVKIVLLNDITLNGQTAAYTTNAKNVIIESNQQAATRSGNEGNKKFTLTFKDSYRTYFDLANEDAKVTFNNVNIYRETTGGSHWHDNNMKFCSNAEFNNVDFNKGICFDDAKTFVMNNCSINKGKVATYALFITAGCDVTIDGLSVTHSEGVAGRGIKIVDEDVAEKEALTTLSVSNATFVTESKAAIMIGSQGGAEITLNNLDLSGVKADQFNAVWIDEDYKDKDIAIEVEGGFYAIEGDKGATEAVNPFLIEGNTVNVAKGVYSALPKVAKGVTIEAEEGTVFTGTSSVSGENVTIKNVTFKSEDVALTNNLRSTTFENCHFDAAQGARWCYAYGDVKFINCTFGNEECTRGVHFDDGEGSVTFEGCTFYGFQALGSGVEMMTFNGCMFAKNKNYNVVNMYNKYEFNNCEFCPEMNTDCASNGVIAAFNNCSYTDGKSIYTLVRFDKDPTTCKISFNGEEVSLANNVAQLKNFIAAANNEKFTKIVLMDGTYTGAFDITGKSVELVAANKHQATIDGLVHGLDYAHITLKDLVLTNATPATSTSARHTADGYCVGAYVADILIEDCIFNVKSTDKGAINIYANRSDYELYDDFDLTVKNTTFNCNGERPIRGKTNSWIEGCTFIDQHRYAIQVQGNVSLSSETVKFIENKIIDPCKTSGESYAAGVSISKSQLLEDAHFIIEGNTLESTKFDNLKFVYDLNDNVKITTCTLNGKAIVEGQLEAIEGVDDAKEVLDEVQYTWDATTRTFTAYTAKGLKKANEMMVDKSMGKGATLVLANDIDFTGYTWTPVDSHADGKFEIKEINGNYHTISNLTVKGQAMFTRFAGSGNVTIQNITFDKATVNSNGNINTAILTGHSYQNVLLYNVDVKNSTITGGYKVAPLIGTVYNENVSTVTATLEGCDIENVTVKATSYDFCTTGMVAFVYAGDNDKIEFENCTVKDVKLYAPNVYSAHAAIYTTGSDTLFNEAEGVTVENVTFENI